MFGLIKTWKALEAKGIMGINRRNADYVLKYITGHRHRVVRARVCVRVRARASSRRPRRLR